LEAEEFMPVLDVVSKQLIALMKHTKGVA